MEEMRKAAVKRCVWGEKNERGKETKKEIEPYFLGQYAAETRSRRRKAPLGLWRKSVISKPQTAPLQSCFPGVSNLFPFLGL